MSDRFYGVKKGSKRSPLRETVLIPTRMSLDEARDRYDELEDRKRKLARSAARFIHVTGLQPGDTIPAELSEMRRKMRELEKEMAKLVETHRGLNR